MATFGAIFEKIGLLLFSTSSHTVDNDNLSAHVSLYLVYGPVVGFHTFQYAYNNALT